ncbi:MAG: hypothetical protein Hals2KO_18050 [Halioglobus sp.]
MSSLEEYLAAVPDDRAARFTALRDHIRALYPDAIESMRYKMPTYECESGGWVALANQKQYISLYTCAPQHIASFKMRYPRIKTGKGCINFRARDEFDIADLDPVIRSAMEFIKDAR